MLPRLGINRKVSKFPQNLDMVIRKDKHSNVNDAYILMAFSAFPIFMAVGFLFFLEAYKVKPTFDAYYHKQLATVWAFYFFLPFWFFGPPLR